MTGFLKFITLTLLAVFLAIIAFVAGFGLNVFYSRQAPATAASSTPNGPPASFSLMWESWNILKDEFYYDIPAKSVLVHGMIRGALASLGDTHSILVEPAPAQQEATNLQGNYGGIGATVELRK